MPPGVHLGSLRTVVIRIYGRAAQLADARTYPRTAAPVLDRCAAPAKGGLDLCTKSGRVDGLRVYSCPRH